MDKQLPVNEGELDSVKFAISEDLLNQILSDERIVDVTGGRVGYVGIPIKPYPIGIIAIDPFTVKNLDTTASIKLISK